ncbi:MAG: chromosome segregation protein SMC [Clostridia bacterium]|nr:chromosome segregation protein SMC [Clostridia bacterium]
MITLYLKRLEMQGFKSFVDKTVLEFSNGITAIVGPNGSGKSNISDAVKWVLGEQSPKTLRGSKMEDLIFAGTQSRKPTGMCEVSLVMDNEDHALNIDFIEVRVTRRLYRSGESEYLINGAQCRLKDIVMLFADTGIGRDGYSLIGQGRIDEILSTKSEERRNIFEDASGIMKYRIRRNEAERKLAATEQNLLRINDIVRELESQIKPLEKQSEVARKYLGLRYELRDIEVGVLSETISQAETRLGEITGKAEIAAGDRTAAEAELEALRQENESKLELSRQLDSLISQLKTEQFEHEKRVERLSGEIAVNNEKIVQARASSQRADNEKAEQTGRMEAYNADIDRLNKEIAALDAELAEVNERGGAQADLLNATDARLAEAERETNAARAEQVRLQLLLTEKNAKAEAAKEKIAIATARKESLDLELEAIRESDTAGEGELSDAEKAQAEAANIASDAKQEYQNGQSRLAELRAQIDSDNRTATELTGRVQSLGAQCKLLREMEEEYEGYARSVKEVLQMCKKNPAFGDGIYGAVAQLITVSKEYELAIETALGQSYQNIITESEEETKAAIEFLKEHRYGRATFMPLTAVTGRRFDAQLERELRGLRGYLGIASDRVECEARFRVVADSLLGRVAVFRTLDDAIDAAKKYKYGFMSVTLEGDLLRTSGAITGGAAEKGAKTTGALSRTREIPKLEKELDEARKKIEKLLHKLHDNKEEADQLSKQQTERFEKLRELEKQASALDARVAALRERQEGRRERRGKLVEELKSQISQVVTLNGEIGQFKADAEQAGADIAAAEKRLEQAARRAEEVRKEREAVSNALFAVKIDQNRVEAARKKAEENIDAIKRDIETLREKLALYETQKQENAESVKNLEAEIHRLETQKAVSALDAENAAEKLKGVEGRKAATDETLGGMLTRITDINTRLAGIEQEINRLEIQRVRCENEINSGRNRLWEEYELTLSAAKELAEGIVIEDYKAAAARINELRSAIKALGPVNVNAVEEYESTVERYNFMSAQSKDMNDARLKLRKVVDELTEVMCAQFSEQFKLIRENFNQVFTELFGGGKADIVLAQGEDGANVLDCGIDINVQPPGKKLQNMLLLSGGERALTAIALLFAILRLRPSPFCLLDEIEAALDDANVYRLSDYLEGVSKNTQFIMVTHRKGTMEYAGSLYGVTMEEKGISRVVSLRMDK